MPPKSSACPGDTEARRQRQRARRDRRVELRLEAARRLADGDLSEVGERRRVQASVLTEPRRAGRKSL